MCENGIGASPFSSLVTEYPNMLGRWLALPVVEAILASACLWAIMLILVWLLPCISTNSKRQGADRLVAMVNASVAAVLGLSVEIWLVPGCSCGNSWVKGTVILTLGYLLVDGCSMLVCDVWKGWRKVDVSMLIHHVFIIFCFGSGCVCDIGVYFLACLLFNEASTPCLSMKWFFEYNGYGDSCAYKANAWCFLISFTLSRMIFIPFSFYQLASVNFCFGQTAGYGPALLRSAFPPLMILGYVGLFSLNLFWYVKLIRSALRRLGFRKRVGASDYRKLANADAQAQPADAQSGASDEC